ncbi:MAG TPA: hypothetical protein VFH77_03075 [Streptomyces sp.]|nr:hypothetical protein [Streptomyces sp.]
MRVLAQCGDRKVDIRVDGESPELLRQAERTAKRLLAALPQPLKQEPQQAFGFALSGDAERAEPVYTDHDAE